MKNGEKKICIFISAPWWALYFLCYSNQKLTLISADVFEAAFSLKVKCRENLENHNSMWIMQMYIIFSAFPVVVCFFCAILEKVPLTK